MCGKPDVKVSTPKPPNMPPPPQAPAPPKKAPPAPKPHPQHLVEPDAAPDIRIGAAKSTGADRSSGRRNQSLTISSNNQGLNL